MTNGVTDKNEPNNNTNTSAEKFQESDGADVEDSN